MEVRLPQLDRRRNPNLKQPLHLHAVGAKSSAVFGPKGSLDDAPIETMPKRLGAPYTPMDIVRVRQAVERMHLEEQTIKVRRKCISEVEFPDVVRQVARGPRDGTVNGRAWPN